MSQNVEAEEKTAKQRHTTMGIRMAVVDCVSQSARNNAEKVFVEVLMEEGGVTVIVEDDSSGIEEKSIGRFLDPGRVKFYFPQEMHVSSTCSSMTYKAHRYRGDKAIQLNTLKAAEWEEGCRYEINGLLPPENREDVTEGWLREEITSTFDFSLSEYSEFDLDVDIDLSG